MRIRVGGAAPFRGGGKQREAVRGWKGRRLRVGRLGDEWEGAMSWKLRKETASRRRGGAAAKRQRSQRSQRRNIEGSLWIC